MKRSAASFAACAVGAFLLTHLELRAAQANEWLRGDPNELLVNAAAQGDVVSVQRQLTAHTDPNVASKSLSLALPLVQAAANGHAGVISALLQSGARVDAQDGRGQRAIVVAAYHGRLGVCRQLLAAGARVDIAMATADEFTPLAAAVMSSHVAIVELLLQAGAPLLHTVRSDRNALVVAARVGNENMVAMLLDAVTKQAMQAGQTDGSERDLLLLARDEAAQANHARLVGLIEQRIKR